MSEDFSSYFAESILAEESKKQYKRLLDSFDAWLESKGVTWQMAKAAHGKQWLDDNTTWGASWRYTGSCAVRSYAVWRYGKTAELSRFKLKRLDTGPQRTLTAGQAEMLFSQCDVSTVKGIRDRAILAVMLDTGIRAFELCGLLTKNLDLEERAFTCLTKGGAWQTKVISDKTLLYLDEWLTWRNTVTANGSIKNVFVSVGGLTPGMPLSPSGLKIIFRYLGAKAGFEVSPHDFRRTFAVLAIRAGAPTRLVQKQGGWSSVHMVERYTRALTAADFLPYSPMDSIELKDACYPATRLSMTKRVDAIKGIFSPVPAGKCAASPCEFCGTLAREKYLAGRNKAGERLYFAACDSVCAFAVISDLLIGLGQTIEDIEFEAQA